MKRIDRIEKALGELGPNAKITASELAEKLELSRANVSNDLNQLCSAGISVKSGVKPVYYSLTESAQKKPDELPIETVGSFDRFLQENGSLLRIGELAKAAVLYPPQGMHIMLFGETGVGKSMFARMIFDYAVVQNRITDPETFVAFNCADYANNPELLLSQLFGVIKGAYTGADNDRSGLLEQADGGILFLDEVHWLPPGGQETLFMYIDHGKFRRLGETESTRTARVMLICATTEEPESALLRTFTRRIPMHIKIPNLEERTVEERLGLVTTFFSGESRRLGNPIKVSVNSMRALLGYVCPNNVGQLKSDIQLLCALAYSDYLSHKKDSISISSYGLPQNIRNGIFVEKNRRKIWSILAGIPSRFLTFDGGSVSPYFGGSLSHVSLGYPDGDIYGLIERRTEEMRRVGASQEQIDEIISQIMDGYYEQYAAPRNGVEYCSQDESVMGAEIATTSGKMLDMAARELGRTFNENIRYGLALHLNSAIKRIQRGLPIVNPQLRNIQEKWPDLFKTAQQILTLAEHDFNISLPPDEAGFLALFLVPKGSFIVKRSPVQVIVAAHGTGVATGLARTANWLLGAEVIEGFDVSPEENFGICFRKIKVFLEAHKEINEVLLLVDMGSLVNISYDLDRELGIRNECLSLVSTPHVVEAGSKVLLGYSLPDIYEAVRGVSLRILNERPGQNKPKEEKAEKLYILALCTTGEGSARVLKNHLNKELELYDGLCEVVTLQITDKRELAERIEHLGVEGRIIGVVSAFSTNVPVPHVSLTDGMSPGGIKQLQKLIDTERVFEQIRKNIRETLPSLGNTQVIGEARGMIERIGRALEVELDMEMLIGAFCHICCMLDRLKQGEKVGDFPDIQGWMQKYPREITVIRQECDSLAATAGVVIPLDEVCYILSFFKKESLL
ncbi:MAG: sigma 54-interacting transcriptional regulator [Treponema sp.]|jgi:transcriptional regulator with AAA-type ATPase domain/transcriptional regulatory protein LevR|nr:sigma 54-interacting transcriptional regulator [Treponema sp.]